MTERSRLEPLLLRLREVAILLGVSERHVWTLVRAHHLPVVRPPGMRAIRVAREDVEALVASWRGRAVGEGEVLEPIR